LWIQKKTPKETLGETAKTLRSHKKDVSPGTRVRSGREEELSKEQGDLNKKGPRRGRKPRERKSQNKEKKLKNSVAHLDQAVVGSKN